MRGCLTLDFASYEWSRSSGPRVGVDVTGIDTSISFLARSLRHEDRHISFTKKDELIRFSPPFCVGDEWMIALHARLVPRTNGYATIAYGFEEHDNADDPSVSDVDHACVLFEGGKAQIGVYDGGTFVPAGDHDLLAIVGTESIKSDPFGGRMWVKSKWFTCVVVGRRGQTEFYVGGVKLVANAQVTVPMHGFAGVDMVPVAQGLGDVCFAFFAVGSVDDDLRVDLERTTEAPRNMSRFVDEAGKVLTLKPSQDEADVVLVKQPKKKPRAAPSSSDDDASKKRRPPSDDDASKKRRSSSDDDVPKKRRPRPTTPKRLPRIEGSVNVCLAASNDQEATAAFDELRRRVKIVGGSEQCDPCGLGVVARLPLRRGEEFEDPTVACVSGQPPPDLRGSDEYVYINTSDYFRLRHGASDSLTYFINEARGRAPNVAWSVRRQDDRRPALCLRVLNDVAPGEELLVSYAGSEPHYFEHWGQCSTDEQGVEALAAFLNDDELALAATHATTPNIFVQDSHLRWDARGLSGALLEADVVVAKQNAVFPCGDLDAVTETSDVRHLFAKFCSSASCDLPSGMAPSAELANWCARDIPQLHVVRESSSGSQVRRQVGSWLWIKQAVGLQIIAAWSIDDDDDWTSWHAFFGMPSARLLRLGPGDFALVRPGTLYRVFVLHTVVYAAGSYLCAPSFQASLDHLPPDLAADHARLLLGGLNVDADSGKPALRFLIDAYARGDQPATNLLEAIVSPSLDDDEASHRALSRADHRAILAQANRELQANRDYVQPNLLFIAARLLDLLRQHDDKSNSSVDPPSAAQ